MNRKQISGFVAALLCLALLFGHIPSVRAEDCFTINVDTLDMDSLNSDEYVALNLSAQTQGIRVQKYISDSSELAVPVRLTLTQMDSGTLLFDKDYGYQSGTFDSGVIYLPYVDNRTIPYLVTLYVADYVFAMPFMHLQPRLMYNGACTYGVRLRDLDSSLSADWLMGTMVDLTALRSEGYRVVDVCASNYSIIGQATIQMQGDSLCVQLSFVPSANVEVNYLSLYVITDCAGMTTADVSRMPQPARSAGFFPLAWAGRATLPDRAIRPGQEHSAESGRRASAARPRQRFQGDRPHKLCLPGGPPSALAQRAAECRPGFWQRGSDPLALRAGAGRFSRCPPLFSFRRHGQAGCHCPGSCLSGRSLPVRRAL